MGMKPSLAPTVATLVLGAALVGCSDDKPAVCTSADNLQTSVDDLQDIDVTSSTAVSDLESGLTTVQSNLADVKTDAKSEFSPQIKAVDTSYAALKTKVDAAKADPSATTLAAAGTALSALGTDVQTLTNDIQSTC
jgi:capsule polysaccharide export protein KpsE/RkpR